MVMVMARVAVVRDAVAVAEVVDAVEEVDAAVAEGVDMVVVVMEREVETQGPRTPLQREEQQLTRCLTRC